MLSSVCFCGHDIRILLEETSGFLVQWPCRFSDPKTNSSFTHACYSYSFAASDIQSMDDAMAQLKRKKKNPKKTFKAFLIVCYIVY